MQKLDRPDTYTHLLIKLKGTQIIWVQRLQPFNLFNIIAVNHEEQNRNPEVLENEYDLNSDGNSGFKDSQFLS